LRYRISAALVPMMTEAGAIMTLNDILVWASRATGIGYRAYPPLVGSEIDPQKTKESKEIADKLVRDMEALHRELRRIGTLRISPRRNHGH
jgi:hypothetical protein